MVIAYCLDTYALMEIYLGNKKFLHYLNSDFVITDLTLVEFYGVILKEYDEQTAEYWYKKLGQYSIPLDNLILKEAIKFKHHHKKQRISFFDSVGYIFSLSNGFKFVTGDKEFEKMEGVEFIKK